MDSKKRIKNFINKVFPEWKKIDFSEFGEEIDFNSDLSELYKIVNDEIILISYTNISITGSDRPKPQLRVFLDEYSKPFSFAKKHNIRFYLFSIFTKEDSMARGLDNFNPKNYIISIETNFDNEGSRRDLRSVYDYANSKIGENKFLKCTRSNYKVDINQASFIYIGPEEQPEKTTFENFINIFDSRPYLDSRTIYDNKYCARIDSFEAENPFRPYLTAIKSKPFLLLAGISGTGKSRIVRELARACWDVDSEEYKAQKPRNFEMVQVKPNWHDSSELIGYVSRIEGVRYVIGPFLRFMVKAIKDPDTPYFLCLDEMNLAPVEQYFAEYLSVIESRKRQDDGSITTDPIVDYSNTEEYHSLISQLFDDDEERKAYLKEEGGKRLSIPQNLIVVGTVNMDETTFSFSRKVLDRAMTIEMNEVDLYGGLKERHEQIGKLGAAELIGDAVEGVDVYAAHKDVCDIAINYLQKINDKLEGTPFKIAYRTRNEVLLYVVNNLPYNKDEDGKELEQGLVIARALDEITNMKILSRIEGDETKVSASFLGRLEAAIKEGLESVNEGVFENSISLAKLSEMKKRLESGYTSFWS